MSDRAGLVSNYIYSEHDRKLVREALESSTDSQAQPHPWVFAAKCRDISPGNEYSGPFDALEIIAAKLEWEVRVAVVPELEGTFDLIVCRNGKINLYSVNIPKEGEPEIRFVY